MRARARLPFAPQPRSIAVPCALKDVRVMRTLPFTREVGRTRSRQPGGVLVPLLACVVGWKTTPCEPPGTADGLLHSVGPPVCVVTQVPACALGRPLV